MGYHIFNIKKGNEYYRLNAIYTTEEFNEIMEKLKWRLPYNVTVYHYDSDNTLEGSIEPSNPVMKERGILDLTIEDILFNAKSDMKLKDKGRAATYDVVSKCDDLVVVDYEDEYMKIYSTEKDNCSLIAELVPEPITLEESKAFVKKHHRHNDAHHGHKFSCGISVEDELVGVLVASTPKARACMDKYTIEMNRCCAMDYIFNACSKLYSMGITIAKTMGYRKVITYTMPEESGSSLKAVGFKFIGFTQPTNESSWSSKARPRKTPSKFPVGKKAKWELVLT